MVRKRRTSSDETASTTPLVMLIGPPQVDPHRAAPQAAPPANRIGWRSSERNLRAIAKLDAESRRLADAIARGGPLDALIERLTHCQQQRDALQARLPVTVTDQLAKLEERIQTKCAESRNLLIQDVEKGR